MSVINNVLKELENKPSSFTPLGTSGIIIERPLQRKSSFLMGAIFLLFSMIFLTVTIINSGPLDFTGREILPPAVKPTKPLEYKLPESVTIPVLPAPSETNIQITGLQINETDEYMELQFQLEKRTDIFLQSTAGNNYVFHVKNAQSSIDAPRLERNRWLNNIRISKVNDGLEIEFETRKGVLVETETVQHDQLQYWSIKLKKLLTGTGDKINVGELEEGQGTDQKPFLVAGTGQLSPGPEKKSPVKMAIKSSTKKTSELQQLNEAILAVKMGQQAKAKKMFTNLVGGKHDRQVRLYLLQLLDQQHERNLLQKLLLQSLKIYPDDSAFILFHANDLFTSKRYLELIDLYSSHAQTLNIINLLAASYQRTNQHEKAIHYYQKAIQLDSKRYKLWISLGISQQQLGQNNLALESYKTALAGGITTDSLKVFLQQRIRQLSKK